MADRPVYTIRAWQRVSPFTIHVIKTDQSTSVLEMNKPISVGVSCVKGKKPRGTLVNFKSCRYVNNAKFALINNGLFIRGFP